jgi:hypothetical protein
VEDGPLYEGGNVGETWVAKAGTSYVGGDDDVVSDRKPADGFKFTVANTDADP